MPSLLLVMIGGALGSGGRFLVGRATLSWFGPAYPWGTLAVNLLGGLAMGVLAGALARGGQGSEPLRLLLAVGVLGGFTTFSAFSLDAVTLVQQGQAGAAALYVALSVAGSMVALAGGLAVARGLA
jgi:fluoride exporter